MRQTARCERRTSLDGVPRVRMDERVLFIRWPSHLRHGLSLGYAPTDLQQASSPHRCQFRARAAELRPHSGSSGQRTATPLSKVQGSQAKAGIRLESGCSQARPWHSQHK
eukprot:COSAG06_NODE_3720_length_4977_cov_3.200082_5_plen_110_part_00